MSPSLLLMSLDFMPGAVPLSLRLNGRIPHRQARSLVYLLFTSTYLAPCLQSNPSILMGLRRTCLRMILPVVSEDMLGNNATTSSPRRQISWSSQKMPGPHSTQSSSILSLHSLPQLSQSYWVSILSWALSPSSSGPVCMQSLQVLVSSCL